MPSGGEPAGESVGDERDGFERRLREARARRGLDKPAGSSGGGLPTGSWGIGFRAGVEVVSALVVGVVIGLLLDRWLGTTPWGLIGMFFLGAGAGIVNVYRAVTGVGYAPGYRSMRKPEDGPDQ